MPAEPETLRQGFAAYAQVAQDLGGWALMIIGGSIATIFSTSYLRPEDRWIRRSYLLLIPGWICLATSLYYGARIKRRALAAVFIRSQELLMEIGQKINGEFALQLRFMGWGLSVFALWLLIFLIWWIFGRRSARR